MKHIIAILILTVASTTGWASCKSDVGGTFKTSQPELVPHNTFLCFECREINQHPQDIRNFMMNWAALGPYPTSIGAGSVGRYVLGLRLDQTITSHNPHTGQRSDVMSVPVCNTHGQCATGSLQLVHNIIRINFAMGWYLEFNSSVREVKVEVHMPNGDIGSSGTYSAAQVDAYRQQDYKLPIPADDTPDAAHDGDCLNNLGQERPPDSEMTPAISGGAGWGGGSGDYPGQHWYEEEEAYGGHFPTRRCGTTVVAGGESRTTCGWFWF